MITIVRYRLHVIPADGSTPKPETIPDGTAVDDYVSSLLEFLSAESSVRRFQFPQNREPEARAKLVELLDAQMFDDAADVLAKRLHESQLAIEQGTIEVTPGDLLCVHLQQDGTDCLLLAKLDQTEILSRRTWQREPGFPFEKNRLLKTCFCRIDLDSGNPVFSEILVFDSNTRIAQFWWRNFLELGELTNDGTNSQRAYAEWKRFLEQNVKKKSEADFISLRNALAFHFRTSPTYSHKEVCDMLLKNYPPASSDIDIKDLHAKAVDLPKKFTSLDRQFEERFNIDPAACHIRSFPIRLTADIDLLLRQPVENLSAVVKPVTHERKKGVFIVSEEGYERLNSNPH